MTEHDQAHPDTPAGTASDHPAEVMKQPAEKEIGGPKETGPTRYGDWTVKGRCIDF